MQINKEKTIEWLIPQFKAEGDNDRVALEKATDRYNELVEMDYLKVQPYNDPYDWFNDLCLSFINKETLPVNEINLCGGRMSMKTFKTCRFIAILMALSIKYDLKVACYGFRYIGADINELRKEFERACDNLGLEESKKKTVFGDSHYMFKAPQNKPVWNFINGSFIQLQGVHNSRNSKIALKGLGGLDDFDLAIIFREEANEYEREDTEAIDFAVRGAKQLLKISASNPDVATQDYIKYCAERLPFDKEQLLNNGYQMSIINENGKRKLFLYANYQINPYLTPHQILEFTELKNIDPLKYDIWGLGMPGALTDSIFGHYMHMIDKGDNFKPCSYAIGLDLGQSDAPDGHPTVMEMIGIDSNKNIKVVNEYFHSNATMHHLDADDMCREILTSINKPFKDLDRLKVNYDLQHSNLNEYNRQYEALETQCRILNQGTILRYDYGAGGAYLGQRLDEIRALEYNMPWLTIKPVDKTVWYTKDRIDITIAMITSKTLKIDETIAPNLIKQMNIMRWKVNPNPDSNHKLEMIDLNDDCWDALMYSLMFMAKATIDKLSNMNSLLIKPKVRD